MSHGRKGMFGISWRTWQLLAKGTTFNISTRGSAAILGATLLAIASGVEAADDYPTRSVTVVVPFPAGGPSDVVARIVTDHMAKTLHQSFVIENIGGAGGVLGSARVASSAPDGYTLLAASMGSHVAAPVLAPNIKYDPIRDFEPIGLMAHAPAVIVARKTFPAGNLAEFIEALRKLGASVTEAHGGIGASSHMACLLFTTAAHLTPTLVAYRGTGPAINDLVGGHVDFLCDQAVSLTQQINEGTIKAYAVSSHERLAVLPQVPTAAEAGIDYQMSIWAGMFAPRGTAKEVVDRLAQALNQALEDGHVQKRLSELGGTVPAKAARTPAKFDDFVRAEIARWAPILKAASVEK
jgi:tripartite-type tricarboxylate transporter receptor subunit TctC